jgi:hypothetical protein
MLGFKPSSLARAGLLKSAEVSEQDGATGHRKQGPAAMTTVCVSWCASLTAEKTSHPHEGGQEMSWLLPHLVRESVAAGGGWHLGIRRETGRKQSGIGGKTCQRLGSDRSVKEMNSGESSGTKQALVGTHASLKKSENLVFAVTNLGQLLHMRRDGQYSGVKRASFSLSPVEAHASLTQRARDVTDPLYELAEVVAENDVNAVMPQTAAHLQGSLAVQQR